MTTIQPILNVLLALLVLLFMITVHEFGHFTAGRLLKFQINEFAVGMGPKIFSKKAKDGTLYSLRALPLGGFCAFEGENDDTSNPRAFHNQKPWKRIIVLLSGALFNFVSAIIICSIVFLCYGDTVVKVNNVYDYAPTINQQLEGKTLYKINGKRLYVLDGISRYLDDQMTIEVIDENGNVQTIDGVQLGTYFTPMVSKVNNSAIGESRPLTAGDTLYSATLTDGTVKYFCKQNDFKTILTEINGEFTLRVFDSKGNYYNYLVDSSTVLSNVQVQESSYTGMGMSISYQKYKFGVGESLLRVVPYCFQTAMMVLRSLGGIITGAVGLEQVGGPISTISMTSQIVSTGFANVLFLIVLISVNLAVFNLLPVPALDGCQIIFTIIEWIAGKPINRKVQSWINGIGLVLLLGFAILVDLLKL